MEEFQISAFEFRGLFWPYWLLCPFAA
jgi:hypothetical protein